MVVKVGNREYKQIDNIITIDKTSEIYLLQEVADEKYELIFGDGILGKKLSSGDVIKVSYITTDGSDGNGPSLFSYAGTTTNSDGTIKNSSLPVSVLSILLLESMRHRIVLLLQEIMKQLSRKFILIQNLYLL